MNEIAWKELECGGEWLVEYADGDLAANLFPAAERHLSTCESCRREVAGLNRSRKLLTAYFRSPAVFPSGPPVRLPFKGRRLAVVAALLATSAAVLLAVFAIPPLLRPPHSETASSPQAVEIARPEASPTIATKEDAARPEPDAEILALINRETQIARLRAASQILAREPATLDRHLAMEKYLADRYGIMPIGPMPPM